MWATKDGPASSGAGSFLRIILPLCSPVVVVVVVVWLAHRLTHRDKGGMKYKGKIFFLLFMTSNSGQKFPFIMEFKLPKFERDHQIVSGVASPSNINIY